MTFIVLYIQSLKFPPRHQDRLCLKLGHGFIFGQEVGGAERERDENTSSQRKRQGLSGHKEEHGLNIFKKDKCLIVDSNI